MGTYQDCRRVHIGGNKMLVHIRDKVGTGQRFNIYYGYRHGMEMGTDRGHRIIWIRDIVGTERGVGTDLGPGTDQGPA